MLVLVVAQLAVVIMFLALSTAVHGVLLSASIFVLLALLLKWTSDNERAIRAASIIQDATRGDAISYSFLDSAFQLPIRTASLLRLSGVSTIDVASEALLSRKKSEFFYNVYQAALDSEGVTAVYEITSSLGRTFNNSVDAWSVHGCTSQGRCFQGISNSSNPWSAFNMSHASRSSTPESSSFDPKQETQLAGSPCAVAALWRAARGLQVVGASLPQNPMVHSDEFVWSDVVVLPAGQCSDLPDRAHVVSVSCTVVDPDFGCLAVLVAVPSLALLQMSLQPTTVGASVSLWEGDVGTLILATQQPPLSGTALSDIATLLRNYSYAVNGSCHLFSPVSLIVGASIAACRVTLLSAKQSSLYAVSYLPHSQQEGTARTRNNEVALGVSAALFVLALVMMSVLQYVVLLRPLGILGLVAKDALRSGVSATDDNSSSAQDVHAILALEGEDAAQGEETQRSTAATFRFRSRFLLASIRFTNEVSNLHHALAVSRHHLRQLQKFVPADVIHGIRDSPGALVGLHDPETAIKEDPDEPAEAFLFPADEHTAKAAHRSSSAHETSATDDVFSAFGLLPAAYQESYVETMSLGSMERSFFSSMLQTMSQRGAQRSRIKANQFRHVVCTALHIALPLPPSCDAAQLSKLTADFMLAAIPAVLGFGGVIDQQRPGYLVAHFGGSVETSAVGERHPLLRESRVTLAAVNSDATPLHDANIFTPTDRHKSPVRAVCCCFAILRHLAERQSCVFDNITFLIHKASFLVGNVGSRERLSRVVFAAESQRMMDAVLLLNQQVLGVRILSTTRAARVIEGSYARARVLFERVVVVPVDCISFEGDDVAASHAEEAAASGTRSKASSLTSTSLQFPQGNALSRVGGTVPQSTSPTQLIFGVVPIKGETMVEGDDHLHNQAVVPSSGLTMIAEMPSSLRRHLVHSLYQAFSAVIAGVPVAVPGAEVAHRLADTTPPLDTPLLRDSASPPRSSRCTRTLSDVRDWLHQLSLVAELAPLVQHLQYAAEMASPAARQRLPAKRTETAAFKYRRSQRPGWNLFGAPSLAEVNKTIAREQVQRLQEYQEANSNGRQTRSRIRRLMIERSQFNTFPRQVSTAIGDFAPQLQPIPEPNNYIFNELETATDADGAFPQHQASVVPTVSSIANAGGTALFDVFLPAQMPCDAFPGPSALMGDMVNHQSASTPVPTSSEGLKKTTGGEDTGSEDRKPSQPDEPHVDVEAGDWLDAGGVPRVIRDKEECWLRSTESLGSGAYSTVFCGLAGDGSVVALKCVPLFASHVCVADLEQEVNTACGMTHRNIAKYHHWVLLKDYLVIVMELVSGGSLFSLERKFAKLGGLPRVTYLRLCRDCLQGLAYLHQLGVVHCDVKPHNILVAADGTGKLTDFGSVTTGALSDAGGNGQSPSLLRGTALYLAPEVAAGCANTTASDMFSFGVMLFELATGGDHPWVPVDQQRTLSVEERVALSATAARLQADFRVLHSSVASASSPTKRQSFLRDIAHQQEVFLHSLSTGQLAAQPSHPRLTADPDLLGVVAQCLNAYPQLRPTAEDLLKAKIFVEL